MRAILIAALIAACCVVPVSAQMLQSIVNANAAVAGFTAFTTWTDYGAHLNTANRTVWSDYGSHLE